MAFLATHFATATSTADAGALLQAARLGVPGEDSGVTSEHTVRVGRLTLLVVGTS